MNYEKKAVKYKANALFFFLLIAAPFTHANTDVNNQPFKKLDNSEFIFQEKESIDFEVLYFFNLNCPSCINFERFLHHWYLRQPSNVAFRPIPSPVKNYWQLANNAYFAVKTIDSSKTFFDIMERQQSSKILIRDFQSASDFVSEFSDSTPDKVTSALFSRNTFSLVQFSMDIYDKFGIAGTPELILISKKHNTYKISPEFTNNYPDMLTTLDALISYNQKR